MRVQLALLRHEWRLQTHSLRFQFGAVLFVVAAAAPSVMTWQVTSRVATGPGPAVLVAETLLVLPFAGLVLAVIAAGNTARLHGERELLLSARISGFGFLLRKTAALASLVLPATFVVLAVPLLLPTLWSQPPSSEVVATTLWRWLLEVAPRVVLAIAGWLALVRIFRHEVGAFIAVVFGSRIVLTLVNHGLFYLRVRIDPGDWSGFATASRWTAMIPYRLENGTRALSTFPATEAPYPIALALQRTLSTLPIVAAFVLAAFTLGGLLLGRSVADAPPLSMGPDHPVRTLALGLDRIRSALRPDAGLTPRERGVAAVALLVALLLAAVPVVRSRHFRALLEERYETQWQSPGEVTSTDLKPQRLTLSGRLDPDGRIEMESALELYNSGADSIEHLAFELNRGLEVRWSDQGPAPKSTRRGWDRLEVDLESPIAPRSDVVLSVSTAGTPVDYSIPLPGWNSEPFPDRWEGLLSARFSREVAHLRDARILSLANDRSIRLDLTSLAPRPRFTSWQPVVDDSLSEESGRQLLPEQHNPPVIVEIDLELPAKWFLADPCGNISIPVPGTESARLKGVCRVALNELLLLGGAYRPITTDSTKAVLATRTRQEARSTELLETMGRVAELSGRAWPGVESVEPLVAVELPLPFGYANRFNELAPIDVHGQLLGVPELQLTWAAVPIDARQLVASIVTPRLPPPRVVDSQQLLADQLLTAVLMRRMGLSEQTAAMTGRPWNMRPLRRALLAAQPYHRDSWVHRLPAVLFALESQVGSGTLVSSLDDFVRSAAPERDLHDWLLQLEARTGADLGYLWRDYIAGEGLPELRIEEIDVRRQGDAYSLHGTLVNLGTGETRCPIVAKSEREEVEALVTVTSESSTSFVLRTRSHPHTLFLDPNDTCLRFRPPNAKEIFRLGEGT